MTNRGDRQPPSAQIECSHDHPGKRQESGLAAGDRPADEFERYTLDHYFPEFLPAMAELEPIDRSASLAFEDTNGVQCRIAAGDLVCCFLALDDLCLIPKIPRDWRELIPADLWSETMFQRPVPANPNQATAQVTSIELQQNPEGCSCCGARCHFVFSTDKREHRIEQWSVIAAIRLLVSQHALPMIAPLWESGLAEHYEHIDQVGVRMLQNRHGRERGLCLECRNPMMLVTLLQTNPRITPHGRHRLEDVPGFATNLEKILACSRYRGVASSGSLLSDKIVVSRQGIELRQFLADHIHLITGMLAETTGIVINRPFMTQVMTDYLDGLFYLWPTSRPHNIPWLIMRTIRSYSLVGRIVRPNSLFAKTLNARVPEISLGNRGRIHLRPKFRSDVRFSFQNHEIDSRGQHTPIETIQLVVTRENADHNEPQTILDTTLELPTHTFLLRVAEFGEPTQQAQSLVDAANEILAAHVRQRTDLVHANDDP